MKGRLVQHLFSCFDFSGRRRLEAMRPRLYRLAYAWCHDASLADDLAQETLAKALGRSEQLRDEATLEGWLFAILNNCWRDHLRARREYVDVEELDELVFAHDESPERLYAKRQSTLRVRDAIAALPLAQRQVITLVDIEECSYAQVAQVLDVPVGTVMSRLSRARQALKKDLARDSLHDGRAHERPQLRRVK
ncbi:MAG: sigma-70 family RNA polymerase sigma factor [Pseudomonadota bacterium]